MAQPARAFQWKAIPWTLGIAMLLSVTPRVPAREVRVSVLFDGPAVRDEVSATALEQAAKAVYGDGLQLAITPQTRLDGNWSAAKLNAALDRLEAQQALAIVDRGFLFAQGSRAEALGYFCIGTDARQLALACS